MYVMLTTSDRFAFGALLLAVGKTTMRLAVPGQSDTLELHLIEGHWTGEDGRPVTIDSMIHSGEFDLATVGGDIFPKAMTAGRLNQN